MGCGWSSSSSAAASAITTPQLSREQKVFATGIQFYLRLAFGADITKPMDSMRIDIATNLATDLGSSAPDQAVAFVTLPLARNVALPATLQQDFAQFSPPAVAAP